jgi:hypothetical protein
VFDAEEFIAVGIAAYEVITFITHTLCSFTLWCLVRGSDLLSSAVASTKQSKSNSQLHHQHGRRHIHKHPSFIDAVTLLTLALRLASNDVHSIHRDQRFPSSSRKPSDFSSSAWSAHTRQLPIWPNSSGGSLRAKMRAWSLDSLALAAYSLNDFAYRFVSRMKP